MSFLTDHTLETYKSMIGFSKEVFKTLFLLNGGAVIALLSYLGQKTPLAHAVGCFAWLSLGSLAIGLVFAVTCFGFAYLTQFVLFNESTAAIGKGSGGTDGRVGTLHMSHVRRAIISAAMSLAFFILGAVFGIAAIVNA